MHVRTKGIYVGKLAKRYIRSDIDWKNGRETTTGEIIEEIGFDNGKENVGCPSQGGNLILWEFLFGQFRGIGIEV